MIPLRPLPITSLSHVVQSKSKKVQKDASWFPKLKWVWENVSNLSISWVWRGPGWYSCCYAGPGVYFLLSQTQGGTWGPSPPDRILYTDWIKKMHPTQIHFLSPRGSQRMTYFNQFCFKFFFISYLPVWSLGPFAKPTCPRTVWGCFLCCLQFYFLLCISCFFFFFVSFVSAVFATILPSVFFQYISVLMSDAGVFSLLDILCFLCCITHFQPVTDTVASPLVLSPGNSVLCYNLLTLQLTVWFEKWYSLVFFFSIFRSFFRCFCSEV